MPILGQKVGRIAKLGPISNYSWLSYVNESHLIFFKVPEFCENCVFDTIQETKFSPLKKLSKQTILYKS